MSLLPLSADYELVDLGPEAALVYRALDEEAPRAELERAFEAAKRSLSQYPARRGPSDPLSLARNALFGAVDDHAAPDLDDLPQPVEVELTMPSPTSVVLPMDRPRCRP
jgi:hypothetical protein